MGSLKVKSSKSNLNLTVDRYYEESRFTAVTVRKKKPFLTWGLQLPDPFTHTTLESLNEEPPIYLIEFFDDYDHPKKWVKRNWEKLFMEALNGWNKAPAEWPKNLTFALFEEWFEIEWTTNVHVAGRNLKLTFDMPE